MRHEELGNIYFILPMRHYVSMGTNYVPVCLSVTSQCSIKEMDRLTWFFGMEAFLPVLTGKLGVCKNKGTSLWNFLLNSVQIGILIVETRYQ